MKNIIRLIPVAMLALATTLSSCEGWLDVEPKSQVKDKELFKSESGFKEALSGVYSLLVDEPLYTFHMRYGMLGVLAYEWTSFSGNTYPEAAAYDYTGTAPTGRIAAIWEGMYNAVSNVNVILEVIDDNRSLFSGDNYNIIKGEALALRAFIHFDLLRCFGVSYAVDRDKPSIPYVKDYTPLQSRQLTVDQVARLVIEDLENALVCLAADPILTGETVTEYDDNGYLMNRQLHLNYYAVKGLMARVYLYMEEYGNAAIHAADVIGSRAFTWVAPEAMSADPSGATEQLWAIDVNDLDDISESYSSGDFFSLDAATRNLYYDNVSTDPRYQYLFKESESFAGIWLTKKYDGGGSGSSAFYNNKMSMIKLSEMYFILAESYYNTTGDWLGALNEVAEARALDPFLSVTDFTDRLVSEYRKEFLAEGQMFFLYKRLNLSNIYGVGSDVNLVENKAYTFPLPESELRASDRQDNR